MAASRSYNQNPSSSSSTSWDVFLSFRGLDTRNTFIGHLYKDLCRNGIKTFVDDPELLGGEVISRALPRAIQESKTYIVVLSENYASSSWCLEELEEILRCFKRLERLVIPVFYYIDPCVVRHQLMSFKEAFEKHQTRHDLEKVEKWQLTLKEVADFSGYHVSENRSEADIVDEVVSRILLEINPKTLHVATYPVGLDSQVKAVTTLFNSDTKVVIRLGIHGMGGVGKTTLAKAVYNQSCHQFPGSCFLANVRELSRTEQGLVYLQQQLLDNVLKRKDIKIDTVDQGIELIRARICSTKVLVVIDDLDDPKPLKYLEGSFALGSIVIITTRNEDLLDRIEVKAKYKVNQMDKERSRQLFTQHAFGEDKVPHTFTELCKEIVKHAGGLPLALQVFGSTLLNESEDGWKWFIDKLKQAPIDDVEENLMISYDALKSVDPNLQDIFLDIACFYIGWKKKEVAKVLETCYTFVNHKIDILRKRCLITISDKDKLGMHDLLRDMGRKIARNNCPGEPGKYSRLWVSEDVNSVLKNDKGTEAIESIFSGYDNYSKCRMNRVTFDAESFKRMNKLRFLYLNKIYLTGSFEQTFEDLRWLRWVHCPLECLPSDFYPQKLVVLDLGYSNMRTMGEQNKVYKMLKTLDMSHSRNLIAAPDFTRFPCLETLNLEGCSNLRSLPDSILSLKALEFLDIRNCEKLEGLPGQLGTITCLRKLELEGDTMLRKLPDISQLSNIKDLSLNSCSNLLSILELPPNLESLSAEWCTSLKRLPDLSSLKHLKKLDLTNCEALQEIQGLEEVTSLEDLCLVNCTSSERLPNLCNLKHVKDLDLRHCSGLTEIQGLEELASLKFLFVAGCNSSLLACTLTNHLFEIVSGYGHPVKIFIGREDCFWIWKPLDEDQTHHKR